MLHGQPAQDLVFEVEEKPHPVFQRNKDDLSMTHTIPLVDALTGADVAITGIDGKPIKFRVESLHPNVSKTLPNHGMPRKEGGRGNLHVHFNIVFPHLSEQQKNQIRGVMPRA
jgi:DnaJ family protein B protein 4